MDRRNRRVVGIYPNTGEAEKAISDLNGMGYSNDEISVISRAIDDGRSELTEMETLNDATGGDGTGHGRAVGGSSGLLASLGHLVVPGVGSVMAAGPIKNAIAGSYLSGTPIEASGLTIGRVICGEKAPVGDTDFVEQRFKAGDIFVLVEADAERFDKVSSVMGYRDDSSEIDPLDIENMDTVDETGPMDLTGEKGEMNMDKRNDSDRDRLNRNNEPDLEGNFNQGPTDPYASPAPDDNVRQDHDPGAVREAEEILDREKQSQRQNDPGRDNDSTTSSGTFDEPDSGRDREPGLFAGVNSDNDTDRDAGLLDRDRNTDGAPDGEVFGSREYDNERAGELLGGRDDDRDRDGGLFGGRDDDKDRDGGLFGGRDDDKDRDGGLFGGRDDDKDRDGGLFGGRDDDSVRDEDKTGDGGLFSGNRDSDMDRDDGILDADNDRGRDPEEYPDVDSERHPGVYGNVQGVNDTDGDGGILNDRDDVRDRDDGLFGERDDDKDRAGGLLSGNQRSGMVRDDGIIDTDKDRDREGGLFSGRDDEPDGGLFGGRDGDRDQDRNAGSFADQGDRGRNLGTGDNSGIEPREDIGAFGNRSTDRDRETTIFDDVENGREGNIGTGRDQDNFGRDDREDPDALRAGGWTVAPADSGDDRPFGDVTGSDVRDMGQNRNEGTAHHDPADPVRHMEDPAGFERTEPNLQDSDERPRDWENYDIDARREEEKAAEKAERRRDNAGEPMEDAQNWVGDRATDVKQEAKKILDKAKKNADQDK